MTVHEIAALAGVSIGTIDRVLHKRGRVSCETKAKVEAIIEKYQFTPNPIARRLARGRDYRFHVIVPKREQDSGYWRQAIKGIELGAEMVRPLGVETVVLEYDRYKPCEAQNAVDFAQTEKTDGCIIAPIVSIRPLLPELHEKKIPFVFFDADFPEMEPLCTISQDPVKGGCLAARLLSLFAGNIEKPAAVLEAHSKDYHIIKRREGFLDYAGEHGFSAIVKEYSKEDELSCDEVVRFLDENPALSGIFVTNCLAHRVAGIFQKTSAPKGFFIIGYDLIPQNAGLLRAGLIDAIIAQRPEEQCRLAVLTLYRRILLEEEVEKKIEIPLDIYIKENSG